jgi:catechol 2,3-dioxygenase-like lactoylglutathione lyase family enzyme
LPHGTRSASTTSTSAAPDPEAAAAVWEAAFGARIVNRVQAGRTCGIVLDLAGRAALPSSRCRPGTPAPPKPPFLGLEHVGLTVDDLDAAMAALEAKGIARISGPSEPRPGVRIAFFAAPDGVQVELIERR